MISDSRHGSLRLGGVVSASRWMTLPNELKRVSEVALRASLAGAGVSNGHRRQTVRRPQFLHEASNDRIPSTMGLTREHAEFDASSRRHSNVAR